MSTFYGRLRRLVVRGSTRLIGALTGTSATFSGSVSAGKVTVSDSATQPPLNLTERATAPSSPAAGDIYLDDGSNTGSGNPGFRRYTGAAWEDVTAAAGGSSLWTDDGDGTISRNSAVDVTGSFYASANITAGTHVYVGDNLFFSSAGGRVLGTDVRFSANADIAAGNMFSFVNYTAAEGLTDANGEQSWVAINPRIEQSGTAGYNALKIDATETSTGDGSAGQGNNLIWAGVGGTRKFEVDNTGVGYFAGALTAASYADNTPGYNGDALAELSGVETVGGEIDHDTLPPSALVYRTVRHITKATRTEVDAAEALETYDAEVPAYDIVDVADKKTGKIKQAKSLRVTGQKIAGYELSEDGTVTEKTEPVYDVRTVAKKRLRDGYEFDEASGKFYRKGAVTVETEQVPGRDLGAMISILTVAVQQLTKKVDALEADKLAKK